MRWSFFLVTVFLALPRSAAPQTHYQIPLWQRIKRALQAPDGLEYFRSAFHGATIPGGVDGPGVIQKKLDMPELLCGYAGDLHSRFAPAFSVVGTACQRRQTESMSQ